MATITTPGPLETFANPNVPMTLSVELNAPGGGNNAYLVDVVVIGPAVVNTSQLFISASAGTADIVYTPNGTSSAVGDVSIKLNVHPLSGGALQTDAKTATNYEVVLPVIRAKNTPNGMADRVSLGAGTPGEFQGDVGFFPAKPANAFRLDLRRTSNDDKYGSAMAVEDASTPSAATTSARGATGVNVRYRVYGTKSTQPSRDINGNDDRLARNKDGLRFRATLAQSPGSVAVDGPLSFAFSVAAIPIAVEYLSSSTAENGTPQGDGTYFFGYVDTLKLIYDRTDKGGNYVGEFVTYKNTNGLISSSPPQNQPAPDSGSEYLGTTNWKMTAIDTFADHMGIMQSGLRETILGLSSNAKKMSPSVEKIVLQKFRFLNTQVDDLSSYTLSCNAISNVASNSGYQVNESYFETRFVNTYTATGFYLPPVFYQDEDYQLTITRTAPSPVANSVYGTSLSAGRIAASASGDKSFSYRFISGLTGHDNLDDRPNE